MEEIMSTLRMSDSGKHGGQPEDKPWTPPTPSPDGERPKVA